MLLNKFKLDRLIKLYLIAAALLIFSIPAWSYAQANSEVGDVNGDGHVTASDAAILLRSIQGFAIINSSLADVTLNGMTDEVDARVILSHASGKIPSLTRFMEIMQDGLCDETLFDRFSYTGAVEMAGEYYRDELISVEISEKQFRKQVGNRNRLVTCYVAEICLQDLSVFRTAFSSDKYRAKYEPIQDIAMRNNAIVAISGDFYSSSLHKGPVNRNGIWYSLEIGEAFDLGVLLYDGTLVTIQAGSYDEQILLDLNPYQLWCFGPSLITENGGVPEAYNIQRGIMGENPRSAIGSDGPGHYFFVIADGRRPDYSSGLNMIGLSEFFIELGCTVAYNLDGGNTAAMATSEGLLSIPSGTRKVSDILYIEKP
jgi:exopolysaccharide biosynthesis protein